MGFTFVEKVLAKASGLETAQAGQMVQVKPNLLVMYDWEGLSDYIIKIVEDEIGKVVDGDKLVFFIDHKLPPTSIRDQTFHLETIKWAKKRGVSVTQGMGIGHQLVIERGLVNPGNVVVHFDRHVNILGGVGVFSVGSRLELIMSLVSGEFTIQVPETIRVNLHGQFQPGVMGRDILHRIVGDIGPDGALNEVLEFGGQGASTVSIDSRLTICCLAMFSGATTFIFEPDEAVSRYFKDNFSRDVSLIRSDPDCHYKTSIDYDLSKIEPQLVKPPNPQDTVPLKDLQGKSIQQGYIGSCASGRLEDIAIAAKILKGRKLSQNFRLHVVPCSNKIMAEAARLGYIEILANSGAWINSPTCDFCYGKTQVLSDGETALSTGTLNVPGRMGNTNSEIYIASAASVAAAAIDGCITDPRRFL